MGRYDVTGTTKPVSRIIIVCVVLAMAIAAGMFYMFKQQQETGQREVELATETLDVPVKPDTLEVGSNDRYSPLVDEAPDKEKQQVEKPEQAVAEESFQLPPLNESDELFRENLVVMSSGLGVWLQGENLITSYMTIINDFSQGLRIYKHMRFLSLNKPFAVKQDQQGLYIDPAGYNRYNQLVAAVNAISVQEALSLYKRYRPLFQQVFEQFGYPDDHHVDDIMKKAVANIVAAPVIEARIGLIRPTVRYKFADKNIESLDPVQKQMIRMGPENTRVVQEKLRAFVVALIADNNL
ncbi:MAG: DUF3014 domain-containing protein [Thiotrichaceae bacterium]|nr:DUF3014 domain-containing protein [Thiotrichaceae bacterium]